VSSPDTGRLEEAQRRLGVRFRDPALLEQAFIHRSLLRDIPDSGLQSNERLEFLGDAIIGAHVARFLYERLPEASEGELTLLRTWLVRASTLGAWAAELELER
jgi:ribonuclease-3